MLHPAMQFRGQSIHNRIYSCVHRTVQVVIQTLLPHVVIAGNLCHDFPRSSFGGVVHHFSGDVVFLPLLAGGFRHQLRRIIIHIHRAHAQFIPCRCVYRGTTSDISVPSNFLTCYH